MKIERISDNQIRCTLNKSDLAGKETLLNDLAFGSDKAQNLFQDLMKQASDELGFETENSPLMVEAIPKSEECLVLIITKVDASKKFSKQSDRLENILNAATGKLLSGKPEDFMDLLGHYSDHVTSDSNVGIRNLSVSDTSSYVYCFHSLEEVGHVSRLILDYPHESSLYKDEDDGRYFLCLSSEDNTYDFKPIQDILNEYSLLIPNTYATNAFFHEHMKAILEHDAVATMSQL